MKRIYIYSLMFIYLLPLSLQSQSPGEGTFDRSLQLNIKNSEGTIAVIQFDGYFVLGTVRVCEDEEITIEISDSFPLVCQGCPTALFYNELSYCDGECIDLVPPNVNIQYQGGSYDYTTDFNDASQVYSSCYTSSKVIATLTPSVTDTFSISWQTVRQVIYEESRPCNPAGYPFNQVVNYSNQVRLEVRPDVEATLSAPQTVLPGAFIPIVFSECVLDLRARLLEECTNWDENVYNQSTWANCGFNNGPITFGYVAPRYTTELKFRAIYGYPICESEFKYTNEIIINVEENPVENACNSDPIIALTETDLQNPELINGTRIDYHQYEVEKQICTDEGNNCSINQVWTEWKSNIAYQIPQLEDFEPYAWLPFGLEATPSSGEIVNCQEGLVASPHSRLLAKILVPNNGFEAIGLQDPVKIVVDEDCKCITNYTLPGHILHPGKVRRCLYLDNCNDIVVKTTGTGFHYFGNNALGFYMGVLNEFIGETAFENMDVRFNNNYN